MWPAVNIEPSAATPSPLLEWETRLQAHDVATDWGPEVSMNTNQGKPKTLLSWLTGEFSPTKNDSGGLRTDTESHYRVEEVPGAPQFFGTPNIVIEVGVSMDYSLHVVSWLVYIPGAPFGLYFLEVADLVLRLCS